MMLRELAEAVATSTMSTQIKLIQDALTRKGIKVVGAPGVASKEFVAAVNTFLSAKNGSPATPGAVAAKSIPQIITQLTANANSIVNPGDDSSSESWLSMAYALQWYATHIENEALAATDPDAKSVLSNKSAEYAKASKAIMTVIQSRLNDQNKYTKLSAVPSKLTSSGDNPMRAELLREVKSDKPADLITRLNRKSSV